MTVPFDAVAAGGPAVQWLRQRRIVHVGRSALRRLRARYGIRR